MTDWPKGWDRQAWRAAAAEYAAKRPELPNYEENPLPPHIAKLRRLVADPNVTLERMWSEVNRQPAPTATLEALMHSLRTRGLSAVSEPNTRRRLMQMDDQQLAEIVQRLLKPKIGQPWLQQDVENLIELHGALI
jgi:hypothetical protein